MKLQYSSLFIIISVFLVQHKALAKTGEGIYKENCYSCHLLGTNKLDPNKPIIGSAALKDINLFADQLKYGTGMMPAFPNIVKNNDEFKSLYEYCLKLKK